MEAQTAVGAIGAQNSPISPTSRHGNGNGSFSVKRKRSINGFESSPGSLDVVDNEDPDEAERRRQPGVKRACNECRQQKVSLDG